MSYNLILIKFNKKLLINKIENDSIPEPNTGCLLWTKSTHKFGYGYIRLNKKTYTTHRLIATLYNNGINENKVVMHKCDTPSCNNIFHLKIATQDENIKDASIKKRIKNQNSFKTHCKKGHEFKVINNIKICKICKSDNFKKSFSKNYLKYKDRIKINAKNYRENNKELIRLKKIEWRKNRKLLGYKVT